MVVLDTDAFDGSMSDATAQAIVMHETAHVLGLGHTDARETLRVRETNTFQVDFGDGDEAGLGALARVRVLVSRGASADAVLSPRWGAISTLGAERTRLGTTDAARRGGRGSA